MRFQSTSVPSSSARSNSAFISSPQAVIFSSPPAVSESTTPSIPVPAKSGITTSRAFVTSVIAFWFALSNAACAFFMSSGDKFGDVQSAIFKLAIASAIIESKAPIVASYSA